MVQDSTSSSTQTGPSEPETPPASITLPPPTDPKEPWSVQSALSTFNLSPPPPTPPTTILPFTHLLERLKTTPREGWRRFSTNPSESIADHMYRMSILTMLCPQPLAAHLDIPRCTKMALCHDMAEALVGDITPQDKIAKEEKRRREAETMDYLTRILLGGVGSAEAGQGMREVWLEYEENETLEAKFVHDIDKVELIFQMMEYERREEGNKDLGEFVWVAEKIELPEVKRWCAEVLRERAEFWKKTGKDLSKIKGLDIGAELIGNAGLP